MKASNNYVSKSVKDRETNRPCCELLKATGREYGFSCFHVSSSVECGDNTFVRNIAQVNGSGTVNGK